MRAAVDHFRIHDATFSVWYEIPGEETRDAGYKNAQAAFHRMLGALSDRGWTITSDPHCDKHYKAIAKWHRYGRHGGVELKASVSGRHVEFKFFQNVTKADHPSGGEYEYDHLEKMPYLLRLQTIATHNALKKLCVELGLVDGTKYPAKTPREHVMREFADIRRYHPGGPYNLHSATDGDGVVMQNGDVRCYRDYKGHLHRGEVWFSLNQQWYVIESAGHGRVMAYELFTFDATKHRRGRSVPPRVVKGRYRSYSPLR